MKEVSFYIPCFNAQKYIKECIESILAQTYPLKEIILIDDASTDNSIEIVSAYPAVKIIKKEKNCGLALARNSGLEASSGDFIATCDSDVVLDVKWLENIMKNFSDDKVAGSGGKLLERNKEHLPDKWRALHLIQHWGEKRLVNPRFIYGANTVFRRDVLISAGKYNELFRTNREDFDVSQRVKKAGYKIIYDPEASAEHIRTDSIQSVLNTYYGWKKYDYMQNDIFYEDFVKLAGKIDFSAGVCYDMIANDISRSLFDLIYPTFLILFRFLLRDIRECKENRNELSIAGLIIKNVLLRNKYVNEKLAGIIIEDIKDLFPYEGANLRGLEKRDFMCEMKNLFGGFNEDFIDHLFTFLEERVSRMPSLFILRESKKPAESKFYIINRMAKDKIKGFIQGKASGSKNFSMWETLRYAGEQFNLKLRHKSYNLLKYPSEEQSLFFWETVEKSSVFRC